MAAIAVVKPVPRARAASLVPPSASATPDGAVCKLVREAEHVRGRFGAALLRPFALALDTNECVKSHTAVLRDAKATDHSGSRGASTGSASFSVWLLMGTVMPVRKTCVLVAIDYAIAARSTQTTLTKCSWTVCRHVHGEPATEVANETLEPREGTAGLDEKALMHAFTAVIAHHL
jgi:hypothetical protein